MANKDENQIKNTVKLVAFKNSYTILYHHNSDECHLLKDKIHNEKLMNSTEFSWCNINKEIQKKKNFGLLPTQIA